MTTAMNSWSGHSDVTDTTVVFDRTSLLSSANPAKLIVLYILRSLISSAVFKYAEPRRSASPQADGYCSNSAERLGYVLLPT